VMSPPALDSVVRSPACHHAVACSTSQGEWGADRWRARHKNQAFLERTLRWMLGQAAESQLGVPQRRVVSGAFPFSCGPCWLRFSYVTPVLVKKLRMETPRGRPASTP
jgi:hypothetical protein